MKNLLLIFCVALLVPFCVIAQQKKAIGHNIHIQLKPFKNTTIFLGTYYGKGKTLADSAALNSNSEGAFKGNKPLTEGIYFVVSPQYTIQFEVLVGKEQHFSILADSANKLHPVITGSPDNALFLQYSQESYRLGSDIDALQKTLALQHNRIDSLKVEAQLKILSEKLHQSRENIIQQHPNSLLAFLLQAMHRPEAPAIPVVNSKPDSLYPYRYVKEHYWDDVMFNDDRLLHTPFFEPKLDDYFKYYVSPAPDSIINEVNYIVLSARTGKEIYPYLLTKFTNKYLNPEFMGQDKVFLFLYENFYAKGDTVILNAESKKMITDRAYSMMANQIGAAAPELNLTDTLGKNISLYSLKAPFTVVVFWDPTCGHCKEELPKIDSIYKVHWKAMGVKLYSVNVNEARLDDMKQFVHEHRFSPDWMITYQTKEGRLAEQKANEPNYRQLYDVFKTPTLYLLDADKHIIAKQLTIEQIDNLMQVKRTQKQ